MPRRNYQELSPFDFECLVRDLMQQHLDRTLQVFPLGRDGGIDVAGGPADACIVIQCKHSPQGNFSTLKSAFRKEAQRLKGRDLGQYWIATSGSLTLSNKKAIAELFADQHLPSDRVLAQLDIDNLLNLYPHIEQQHYKLYMSSVGVLERLLRPELNFRNDSFREEIVSKIRIFVQTQSFIEARHLLFDRRVCIISGPPGVGKTTLAQMLILDLASSGYSHYIVAEDLADAEAAYKKDTRQVFLYDDFLGQTSLRQKLTRNEDQRLLNFIDRVRRSDDHYLILTTREYILKDAQRTYEKLRPARVDIYKYIVSISGIALFERAQILYNHLYYANLPAERIEEFVSSRAYFQMTASGRFNPRLIEFALSSYKERVLRKEDITLSAHIEHVLLRPVELWGHIFENQLSSESRLLLWSAATAPGLVSIEAVARSMSSLEQTNREYGVSDVREIARDLDGVFLRTRLHRSDYEPYLQISVPSLVDYMKAALDADGHRVRDLFAQLPFFEQLTQLLKWAQPNEDYLLPPSIFISPSGEPSQLTGLALALKSYGCEVVERLMTKLQEPSEGLHSSLPIDQRVRNMLELLLDLDIELGQSHSATVRDLLLDYWLFHEDASKETGVEIATIIARMSQEEAREFYEVTANVRSWTDVELDAPQDHSLRYQLSAALELGSPVLARLRSEFVDFGRSIIARLSSSDDAESIYSRFQELVDAMPVLEINNFAKYADFVVDVYELYDRATRIDPSLAAPRPEPALPRKATMSEEERWRIAHLFKTLT